jgi:hypothetical protein
VAITPDRPALRVFVLDELLVSDVDERPEPVSALPGAATARAMQPRATRPNAARAAVPAMRFLIMSFLFSEPGWLVEKGSGAALNETSTPQRVVWLRVV